jgi:DNA-directed RNA polymerase specialized sigma24 family protein
MNDSLIWNTVATGLEDIYDRCRAGEDLKSESISKRFDALHIYVVAAASSVLDSPSLRHSSRDPETVANRFRQRMEKSGFRNFDPAKGSLLAYVSTILRSLCREDSRKWHRRRTKQIPYAHFDASWDPSEEACKREWDIEFRKAVRRLPKNYRRAFILKYVLQKSSAEGAERCGLRSVATFCTWSYQARKLLREQLRTNDWLVARPNKIVWRDRRNYIWKDDRNNPNPKE